MDGKGLRIVPFSREFLELSWHWLNEPEIKKLTSTPDFNKKQQEDFFSSLPRSSYLVWGLVYEDKPIGVVGLKNISAERAEYFGYIGEKEYWGRGLFNKIFDIIKSECRKIKVDYIYLHVSVGNSMAMRAYEKNGFTMNLELSTELQKYMSVEVN